MHALASSPNSFFLVVFATVVLARIYLYGSALLRRKASINLVPKPSLGGIRIHHYVYGIVICAAGLLMKQTAVVAFGFGLMVDEVWFVIGLGAHDQKYRSRSSLIGAAVTVLVVFLLRRQIFALVTF